MEAVQCSAIASDLDAWLAQLPAVPRNTSLGADIDAAHRVLLDPAVPVAERMQRFRRWASQHQPCMFGRLGARGLAGIGYDICWLTREMLGEGSAAVAARIQAARRAWKLRAAQGLSHGFLVVFNAAELACAPPGPELLQACRRLCDLLLVEHAPVSVDTIYTESIPMRAADGAITCLKGGMNVFHSTAHRTRNHDRRIPGGVVISVNSPGLLAHSLVTRGLAPDLATALERVRTLAWASIGHGGLSGGRRERSSCSWHNLDVERAPDACPMKHRPRHVPENFSTATYSAHYHTDVLLPADVMQDARLDPARDTGANWAQLDFDYLSTTAWPGDHESFGFVHGQQVSRAAQYRHAWPPRVPGCVPGTGGAAMSASRSAWPMLAAVAATVCWGAGTTLTKLALAWFDPSFLLVIQLGVSLSCLALWRLVSGGARGGSRALSRGSWLGLLEPGLAYFLGLAGLQRIGAAEAVLLSSTESILVILLAWVLAIERPRAIVLLLAATGTVGALLVTAGRSGFEATSVSWWGDALLIGGVLCAAAYVVWSSRRATVTEPLPALIGQQAVALLFAVAMHLLVSPAHWHLPSVPAAGWWLAAVSGLVQYAAAFWLYLWALKGLSASEAGLSLSLIPVFGLLFAIPALGERLAPVQWAGALLIIGAIGLLTRLRDEPAATEVPRPADPAAV